MKWLPRRLLSRSAGSDEQAMRRMQLSGDPAAFTQIVRRWEQPIRRLCIRMIGDEHRGEDLAQEALARVFANRGAFKDGCRFSTWLWRIALNLCYEELRRVKRRGEEPLEDVAVEMAPLQTSLRNERVQLVREAMARLPETHRAVVVLRQFENLKFREIAEVLEVPEGTVKWRMSEALDQLSRELKAVGEEQRDVKRPREMKERLLL
jgi:RNA polymerase sigma-70 factor, ECF subfamily